MCADCVRKSAKEVTVRRTAAAIMKVAKEGRKERDITNVKGNETRL